MLSSRATRLVKELRTRHNRSSRRSFPRENEMSGGSNGSASPLVRAAARRQGVGIPRTPERPPWGRVAATLRAQEAALPRRVHAHAIGRHHLSEGVLLQKKEQRPKSETPEGGHANLTRRTWRNTRQMAFELRDGWQGGMLCEWRLCDASGWVNRVRRGEGKLMLGAPL